MRTWDGHSRVTVVGPMSPGTIKDLLVLMPRCRGCRHWEPAVFIPPSIDPRPGYGECAKARARGGVEDGALAFAFESNFWSADLITAADFGCVQFDPKGQP